MSNFHQTDEYKGCFCGQDGHRESFPGYLSARITNRFFDCILKSAVIQSVIKHRETPYQGERFEDSTWGNTVFYRNLTGLNHPGYPIVPDCQVPVSLGIPDFLYDIFCVEHELVHRLRVAAMGD